MIVMELMLRQSRKEIKSMKNILISKNEWKNAQVTHCLIENIETTHRRCLNSYTQTGAGGGGGAKKNACERRSQRNAGAQAHKVLHECNFNFVHAKALCSNIVHMFCVLYRA